MSNKTITAILDKYVAANKGNDYEQILTKLANEIKQELSGDNLPAPFETLRHAEASNIRLRLIKVWTGDFLVQGFRNGQELPSYDKRYRSENSANTQFETMCNTYGAK